MKLVTLIGSGRKIARFTLPFLAVGLTLNLIFPDFFSTGGSSKFLTWLSIMVLIAGIIVWIWSVVLILTKIPRKELITSGPYSVVKHPLYTGIALLVIPSIGFLCNTWLGVFIGAIVYIGSRIYLSEEEKTLVKIFGESWDAYCKNVILPWL